MEEVKREVQKEDLEEVLEEVLEDTKIVQELILTVVNHPSLQKFKDVWED
jgi:hypothetical protein